MIGLKKGTWGVLSKSIQIFVARGSVNVVGIFVLHGSLWYESVSVLKRKIWLPVEEAHARTDLHTSSYVLQEILVECCRELWQVAAAIESHVVRMRV